ncbi:MAG: hypothetical protein EXX96DRAFT_487048 [Benjaminiella poitrasii]|nr:MAG: hypothetical protein EXX96DRAFT_487048 [Benjaminiella poitrasii]
MDVEEDVNPYHLETLTNIRHYCESQGPEQESLIKGLDTRMEDVANLVGTVKKHEQRLLFVYYNRVKLYNAAKSGRLAGGIAERTVQKWAKRLKEAQRG